LWASQEFFATHGGWAKFQPVSTTPQQALFFVREGQSTHLKDPPTCLIVQGSNRLPAPLLANELLSPSAATALTDWLEQGVVK
jgi:hypothetical protein